MGRGRISSTCKPWAQCQQCIGVQKYIDDEANDSFMSNATKDE